MGILLLPKAHFIQIYLVSAEVTFSVSESHPGHIICSFHDSLGFSGI